MRIPAAQAGATRKMFDFECPQCKQVWEALVRQSEIDAGDVKCPRCNVVGNKRILSPVGIDSHAAASWRR